MRTMFPFLRLGDYREGAMRFAAAIILCGLVSGCAFSEVTVDVPYKAGPAERIANPGPVTLSVIDGRTEDRTRISTKTNGYGMEGGAIHSSRSVPDLVEEAVVTEMKTRGLSVAASGVPVSVTIRRFYCQYHTVEAVGDVVLEVSLKDRTGAQAFTQTYVGTSKLP